MKICIHCGNEYNCQDSAYPGTCNKCASKMPVLPRFAKARDDLRELLGLRRLTKGSEYVD